jgi:predicted nucleic-acid-binding Zn-ribbon protein
MLDTSVCPKCGTPYETEDGGFVDYSHSLATMADQKRTVEYDTKVCKKCGYTEFYDSDIRDTYQSLA